jgi:hypothetical protein
MRIASAKIAIAGALLALTLAGCVVAPAEPGGAVVAYSAPPAVRYEAIGVAPTPGYFWVGGNWFWERGAYNWHPGYWQAPRPGTTGRRTPGTASATSTTCSRGTGYAIERDRGSPCRSEASAGAFICKAALGRCTLARRWRRTRQLGFS